MSYTGDENKVVTSKYLHDQLSAFKIKTDQIYPKSYNDLADLPIIPSADGNTITMSSTGVLSAQGLAPSIGENGNWYIGTEDTGVKVQDSTGRVRLTSDGTLNYLSEIVDSTISIENNTLSVKNIKGVTTSVAELNFIKGLDKNIMNYINSFSNSMIFKGVVATDADLSAIIGMNSGDTYIVQSSISNDGKTMTFVYSGTEFKAIGETSIEIRDFSTNPIDLTSEVTGILPSANIENSHSHTNKTVLDSLSDSGGELMYKDSPIGGSGGSSEGTSNYNELLNKPSIEGNILSGDKTITQLGLDKKLLLKSTYASATTDGYVKGADVATNLDGFEENTQPYMYYGTNNNNEIGKYILPINADNTSVIQQRIFENVSAGDEVSFDSLTEVNNLAIINVYKSVAGATAVDGTIKNYNSSAKNGFYYEDNLTEFDSTSVKVKTTHEAIGVETAEGSGIYSYDLSTFKTISSIESIIE